MEIRNGGNIPGTIISGQNAQTLVSSGIPSLDSTLGGGIPVGTVVLLEEDFLGTVAKVMVSYFLAEGIVSKHSILVASQDVNPFHMIKTLPAVIESDPEMVCKTQQNDKMKIAFRYQNLPTEPKAVQPHFGHFFDLSKPMPLTDIENSNIFYWNGEKQGNISNNCTFTNPAYNDLLKSIKEKIKEEKLFLKDGGSKRNVLRIAIHSLGSPMWMPHRKSLKSIDTSRDLDMFIFCLRALVRSANAVAFVTIPTHLYHEISLERCVHSSDIAMRLQAFTGTELENNSSLSDFHGFFFLTKLAAMNSLASKHPGSLDYVYKLRRKKFVIEPLHLPPDIDTGDERKMHGGTGCGGTNSSIDF